MKAKKLTKPKPDAEVPAKELSGIYQRIREILESARAGVDRTVNTTQVVANWLIGRELVEEEQRGKQRAGYGDALIKELASRLSAEFGAGYSKDNLFWFRRFYANYPRLLSGRKFDALRQLSARPSIVDAPGQISDTLHRKSASEKIPHALHGELLEPEITQAWEPGPRHPRPRLQRRTMNPFSRTKLKLPDKERISPNYSRKISDIVLEFAHEIAPADCAPDIFAKAVGLAVLLWNTPFLPEAVRTEHMDRIRAWLAERGRLDLQSEIARLLELRQTRYGSDRRMVVDYKLQYKAKGPRLSVASLDMDRPENRNCKA
jgi:hypothetical protein